MAKSITVVDDLISKRFQTGNKLGKTEEKYHNNAFVYIDKPLEKKLIDLDLRRKRIENANG